MSETTTKQNMPEASLRPSQLVAGKYRVDRLLGKGGMAEVWAGTNERTGKRIALKAILRTFASSSDAVELFRREALAGSRVNHPNVVNVFDVIDHEGMTCIVMEMLEGEPLGAYLKRKGKLSVEEAITLLLPAMRGVAAANAEGVVHRDLKPQNIFICIGPDGRHLTTKVLDFGISVMREKSADGAEVTQLLSTHGTPAYMSPEHISGAVDIDERADVYGFGVLFFEALTGQVPFAGDPGPALLVRILNEPAPSIGSLRRELPAEIVQIVERAMAKNADDRFRTINDFIRAVEDCFLPSSPLPRSLTPMAGVPLFAIADQKSGSVADSVVQIHRESSGLHEVNHTKALFTLPREASEPHSLPLAKPLVPDAVAPTTAEIDFDLSVGNRLRKLVRRRAVAPLTFAAVVGFVGYLAFPRAHKGAAESKPSVVAKPIVPPASPSPAPVATEPASPSVTTPSVPAALPVANVPSSSPSHILVPVAVPTMHESAQGARATDDANGIGDKEKSARRVTRTVSARHASARPVVDERADKSLVPSVAPRPPTPARSTSPSPRAGALSPDDF